MASKLALCASLCVLMALSLGGVQASVVSSPAIVFGTATSGTASAFSFSFTTSAATAMWTGDKITLTIPSVLGSSAPTVSVTGCGTAATWTSALTNSGTANAAVVFTAGGTGLTIPASTACTLKFATGITTPKSIISANQLGSTVAATIAKDCDMSAINVPSSTAITGPAITANSLVFATATANTASVVSYVFTNSVAMAQGDKITLVLPSVTGSTTAIALSESGNTCGNVGVTGTGLLTNSGTATATFTITTATAAIPAAAACTLITAAGLSSPNAVISANPTSRTNAFTIAATADFAAAAIPTSTAITTVALASTAITTTVDIANSATVVNFAFNPTVDIAVNDVITLVLPSFTGKTTEIALTEDGNTCGNAGAAGTSLLTNSGTATSTLTITVKGAATGTAACTLVTAAGLSTPNAVLTANQAGNTVAVTYASRANLAAATIAASDAITAVLTQSALVVATPMNNKATVISYTFTAAVTLAVSDTITLVLPSFTGKTTTIAMTESGTTCGNAGTAADSLLTNSGTATATFTMTVKTAATGTATCTLISAAGLSSPKVVMTANQADRTAALTYAARANVAAATITTSTAITVTTALSGTPTLTFATTTANTASVVSFMFTSSGYDIAVNDKIVLVLPSVSGKTTDIEMTEVGNTCGNAGTAGDGLLTNSGTATATFTITVKAQPTGTATCTMESAAGLSTPAGKNQIANFATRTAAVTVVAATGPLDIAAATIEASTAVGNVITATSLTFGAAITGKATALTFIFTAATTALAAGAVVTLVVPSLQGTNGAITPVPTISPSSATLSATLANQGQATATIVMTTAGNNVPTAAQTVTIATGLSSPAVVQTANLCSRTFQVASSASSPSIDTGALMIGTSTAIATSAVSSESLTVGTAFTGCASAVTYVFTNSAPVSQGSKITLGLPYWDGAATLTVAGTPGTATFAGAFANGGQSSANVVITTATAVVAPATATTLTIATGLTTAGINNALTTCQKAVVVAASYTALTNAFTLGTAADIAAASISTSTAVPYNTVGSDTLTFATTTGGVASAVTYAFTSTGAAISSTSPASKVTLVLPSLTGAASPTVTVVSCGTAPTAATFTSALTNSGEATATLTLTVATGQQAAGSACTVKMDTGLTTPTASQTANLAARTVQLNTACSDLVAQTIATSTAITATTLTGTTLTFATATCSTASAVTYVFTANQIIAQADKITLVVPSMSGSAAPTAAVTPGTVTMTAALTNSGQATATLTLTTATANIAASTATTVAIASGLTTPSAANTANLSTRTTALTLAAAGDLAATSIATSTAITAGSIASTASVLTFATVTAATASAVTYAFTVTTAPLAASDAVALVLPSVTGVTTALTVTKTGCGTTTWTGALTNSGTATATVTYTAATATLAAATACTVIVATGLSTPAANQAANLSTRTVGLTIAAMCDLSAQSIPNSPAVFTGMAPSVLVFSVTTDNKAAAVSYTFTANDAMAVADTVALVLPSVTGVTTALTVTKSGCGTTTWTGALTNSGAAAATVTYTAATATLAATTACTVIVATGLSTPKAAQAANLSTRTVTATIAANTNSAAYTATTIPNSPAITITTLTQSVLTFAVTTLAANAYVTYQFTASNILASPADKITLAIPSFSASTVTTITPVPYASAGCGSSPATATFTGAVSNGGAATATVALTVASNNVPATTCTVRIPCSAVPNQAQAANYCTRTVALTIASFADMPATTISNSPAISGTQSIASTASVLTITTPVVSEASSVAYAFTAGADIATSDVISIGLPSFTGSTFVSVAEGNTCGTATFTGKFTGSGATAALEVSVSANNVPATTACTLTAASGLTTPSASQAANLNTRTVTITSYPVAGGYGAGLSAQAIPNSPAVGALLSLTASALTITTLTLNTASTLTYTFTPTAGIAVSDVITLVLPKFTGKATNIAITESGTTCGNAGVAGDSLFTNSGQATAQLAITVKANAVPTSASCGLITAAGLSTPAEAQAVNLNTRTVAISLAANAKDMAAASITNSPAVWPLTDSALTFSPATPLVSAAISVVYKFKIQNVALSGTTKPTMAIGDTVTLVLPSFSAGSSLSAAVDGCADACTANTASITATSFGAAMTNSGEATAALTLTAATAALAANTACSITVSGGITTAPSYISAVAATVAVKFTATTGTAATNAVPITTAGYGTTFSTGLQGFDGFTITSASPGTYTGGAGTVTFAFKARTEVTSPCDTITVVLPSYTGSTLTVGATPCTPVTTTFTAVLGGSGTANAAVVLTAGTANAAAGTSCSVVVTGLTSPTVAQAANLNTKKAAFFDLASIGTNSYPIMGDGTYAIPTGAGYPQMVIPSSTAIVANSLTTDSLTLAPATYNTATALTYAFAVASGLALADKITLVLPSFQGTTKTTTQTATAISRSGCGSYSYTTCTWSGQSTFTAAITSASSDQTIVFTTASNALPASTGCTVVLSTAAGISTPASANQAANFATRTVSVTVAATADIAAATIAASTAVTGAPTPSPTPTPTPSSSSTSHYVQATVSLAGVTAAQFDATAQTEFKGVVATGMASGTTTYSASDVTIVSYSRRRALSCQFRVAVADASAATTGASTLNTYMASDTFLTNLQAMPSVGSSITGATVTSSAVAGSSVSTSGVASAATLAVAGWVAILVALRLA